MNRFSTLSLTALLFASSLLNAQELIEWVESKMIFEDDSVVHSTNEQELHQCHILRHLERSLRTGNDP